MPSSRSGMKYVRHVFSFFFLTSFWENLKCKVIVDWRYEVSKNFRNGNYHSQRKRINNLMKFLYIRSVDR